MTPADAMTEFETCRHACEVRDIVRRARRAPQAGPWIDGYLAKVAKHRGQAAADKLRADARKEWAR